MNAVDILMEGLSILFLVLLAFRKHGFASALRFGILIAVATAIGDTILHLWGSWLGIIYFGALVLFCLSMTALLQKRQSR